MSLSKIEISENPFLGWIPTATWLFTALTGPLQLLKTQQRWKLAENIHTYSNYLQFLLYNTHKIKLVENKRKINNCDYKSNIANSWAFLENLRPQFSVWRSIVIALWCCCIWLKITFCFLWNPIVKSFFIICMLFGGGGGGRLSQN